jgi:pterin-4a-carbinolamine dehydratase
MNLKKLHEEFINNSSNQMNMGRKPIEPKQPVPVLIVVDRWRKVNDTLVKTYTFRRLDDRDAFVNSLFDYERSIQHNALITTNGEMVSLTLSTKDLMKVTEIDKTYAAYADAIFKELVYNPRHEDESGSVEGADERVPFWDVT